MFESLRKDLEAYAGCVSGAALTADAEGLLRDAGFENVRVELKSNSEVVVQAGRLAPIGDERPMAQSTVSDHLRILRIAGLVRRANKDSASALGSSSALRRLKALL